MQTRILALTCSARNIKICEFWRSKNKKYDHLTIKHYPLQQALNLGRKFFLNHEEYTHLLIWAEDVIANVEHVQQLEFDAQTYNFEVVSGYSNITLNSDEVNITDKNLSNMYIYTREQYNFIRMPQIIYNTIEYPIKKVFFQGKSLTLIRRDIVEQIEFKPYRIINGMEVMQDLQFAIELHKRNIPQYVDLRVFVPHLGDTARLLNLNPKDRKIIFKKIDGEIKVIEDDKLLDSI